MGRIPQHIIDRIIQESDIVDIICESVPLKKAGANYKACCPFHQEKTPSFVVSPQKQIYHCFGCGVGGNVIGFVMDHEKLTFREALEKLAARAGIPITTQAASPQADRNKKYYKVNAYAHWFFKESLQKSQKAKDYIKNRGLSPEIIREFELGYAPDGFEGLTRFFESKKIPLELAVQLGLIKPRASGGFYDFFRDRLIFPIFNRQGKIVGFGGRTLAAGQPAKYVNSAESPIYNKSHELYGLYQAKKEIIRTGQAVVVEGYIDALACRQLGLKNVVAPLGTSFTSSQVRILKKYAKDVIMMFDGDRAGKKAAIKAIGNCLNEGIHPRLVLLPKDKDPGDLLQVADHNYNLKNNLARAPQALDWLFAQYYQRVTAEPGRRARLIRAMTAWLRRLPDPIEKREYQQKIADYFGIPPGEVEKIVEITDESVTFPDSGLQDLSLEARLIWLYIYHQAAFIPVSLSKLSQDFESQDLRQLAESLEGIARNNETFNGTPAIHAMPRKMQGILTKILLKGSQIDLGGDPAGYINDCLQKFYRHKNKRRLKEITAQIVQADLAQDSALKSKLLRQKQELLNQIKE